MSETKVGWSKVGEQFRDLGTKLREHYLENDPEAVTMAEAEIPPEAFDPVGEAPKPSSETKVKDVVDQLAAAADRIADTVRDAAKDPDLKADAGAAANSVVDALAATFEELGEEFKGLVEQLKKKGGEAAAEEGEEKLEPEPEDEPPAE